MDPFQIRLECVALLRRLTASQQSIGKVVDYAIRHATSAADDIWDCILSECCKTTLNARLNILFLVDALLLHIVDPIGFSASSSTGSTSQGNASSSSSTFAANLAQAATTYLALATRDVDKLILTAVVPGDSWDAVRLNTSSTEKVLASWKRLNIFDHAVLDRLIAELQERKANLGQEPPTERSEFSKQDIQRRIDEDRERHKRLRERAWILPAKSFIDALPTFRAASLGQPILQARQAASSSSTTTAAAAATASTIISTSSSSAAAAAAATSTNSSGNRVEPEPKYVPDALEIGFNYIWENSSDLNEDDLEKIKEVDKHWWGSEQPQRQCSDQATSGLHMPAKRRSVLVPNHHPNREHKRHQQ